MNKPFNPIAAAVASRALITNDPRDLALVDMILDEPKLALCLADEDPREAARRLAGASFDALNAGTRAQAEQRLKTLGLSHRAAKRVLRKLQRLEKRHVTRIARTRTEPDANYQPSRGEQIGGRILTGMRFASLAVAVSMIAIYARASGVSVDISTSWLLALAFGFPALLVSYALSQVSEISDNIETKRRIAIAYTGAGTVLFTGWLAATAYMFGLEAEAANQGFMVDLGGGGNAAPDTVTTHDTVSWISALFPSGAAGRWLLFTHVAADVTLAAAAGVWSKLFGKVGRAVEFPDREEYVAYHGDAAVAEAELASTDAAMAHLQGLLSSYPEKRKSAIEHAVNAVAAMMRDLEAELTAAKTDAIERLRKGK